MLSQELQNAGLSENEAKTYVAALELGETTVDRIAKKSGVKRTTVYLAVETLGEKGLMSHYKSKGKTIYYAENPKKLRNKLEEKTNAIDKILPQLLSITNLIDKKPVIRYFDGKEGIKEVFKDILAFAKTEIHVWYSDSFTDHLEDEFVFGYYIPRKKQKKIWTNAIQPDNEYFRNLTKNNQDQLRRSKLIDPKYFDITVEILLYGDNKIAVMSFAESFALIIESKEIHASLMSFFKTMWHLVPGEVI